jgi:signal transduction histidine kinase
MSSGRRLTDTIARTLRRPGVIGAVLVVSTLGVVAALAYQAARAAASHREAVQTALEHHATTAAWRFAREARGWLGWGIEHAGDAVQREVSKHAMLPGPDVLRRVLEEKYCDCVTAAFGRTFVRVTMRGDSALVLDGEPLSLRARDELRHQALAFAREGAARAGATPWTMLPPGTPRLNRGSDVALLWLVTDAAKRTRAVYGMVVERAQIERPLIGALESAQFFPPRLVPASEAASLVRVEVAGRNRVRLFAAGPETESFVGRDTLGAALGNMIATAAINPDAAQVLIAGGVPQSRSATIIALLLLALVMGVAAAVLARREQRLARLREDFVSGVSHELRTPLTHIRMLSELLASEGFKSPAERGRAIGVIHRESMRLTNLVDNILEFTRLRRSRVVVAPERLALGQVLREIGESLGPLVEAQGNKLEVIADEDVEIRGDRDAVTRVLRNLVENAVKYGPASQTIRMTLTNGSESARVMVDDEGPGIPPDERQRIWQPSSRLDRDRNAAAGGSGLGLSVVADLVSLLGGNVSVGDAPGRGARFIVEFPRAT